MTKKKSKITSGKHIQPPEANHNDRKKKQDFIFLSSNTKNYAQFLPAPNKFLYQSLNKHGFSSFKKNVLSGQDNVP